MKFTMFLVAFAGLHFDFVTASPPPMDLAANPKWLPLGPLPRFRWDPREPHPRRKEWKEQWERLFVKALDDHNCGYSIIHKGERPELGPDGQKTGNSYHNVEEEKLNAEHIPKRLRVYQDGTSRLGWWNRDRLLIQNTKKQARWEARNGNAATKAAMRRAARRMARQRPESLKGSDSLSGGGAKRKAEQQPGSSNESGSSEIIDGNDPSLESWQSMLEQAKRQRVETPPHSPADHRISPNESTPICFHSLRDVEAFLGLH